MPQILLLEDEELLREFLAELLREDGHEVVEAANGLPTYDTRIMSTVDLMITDLFMPQIDGMDAIMTARRDRPDLRIIAMSGGGEFVARDCLPDSQEFGASAILRKPFTAATFMETVRTALAIPAYPGNIKYNQALAS